MMADDLPAAFPAGAPTADPSPTPDPYCATIGTMATTGAASNSQVICIGAPAAR